MTTLRIRNLTCCLCGSTAIAYAQWWNRDNGYGYCSHCAERDNAESYDSAYGYAGIHWFYANPTQQQHEQEHANRLEHIRKLEAK